LRRCRDILLTFFQVKEVIVSRFKSYLPVVASFLCLKCLGVVVIAWNIDKCRLGLECLVVGFLAQASVSRLGETNKGSPRFSARAVA